LNNKRYQRYTPNVIMYTHKTDNIKSLISLTVSVYLKLK